VGLLYLAGIVNGKADLTSGEWLRGWLPELVARIDMKAVGEVAIKMYSHDSEKWPGGAPSGVQFIEESSIQVHCYPERDFIEIVLHSCKDIPDLDGVVLAIAEELDLDVRAYDYNRFADWRKLAEARAPDYATWPAALQARMSA
jgi:S-adenosylmethionine/arginine decarboxylase-like enzyme